jgi:hypothetical protein
MAFIFFTFQTKVMAEIRIEKKRAVWPWALLALLIITGIIYLYYSLTTTRNDQVADTLNNSTTVVEHNNTNNAIADYISYVSNDSNQMGLHHTYTSNALLKLTEAIRVKANEIHYDVTANLDQVKGYALSITVHEYETSHANHIRQAADILSTTLQNMQQAKYPALTTEAKELKDAASAIKPDVLTLDQKNEIKTFFDDAANLLQKMS